MKEFISRKRCIRSSLSIIPLSRHKISHFLYLLNFNLLAKFCQKSSRRMHQKNTSVDLLSIPCLRRRNEDCRPQLRHFTLSVSLIFRHDACRGRLSRDPNEGLFLIRFRYWSFLSLISLDFSLVNTSWR